MAKVNLLTQSEYATHRGCSAVAVHKAVKAGRISLINGKIDPAVADIQWQQNTRARQSNQSKLSESAQLAFADSSTASAASANSQALISPPAQPPADNGYNEARTRRERAMAEEAEMNTAKIRGTMVLREDVDRGNFEMLREVRDHLTACARRVASEVATIDTAEGCEAVIDREHCIALDLIVTSIRKKIGSPPKAAA